jgi:hypothetical protein
VCQVPDVLKDLGTVTGLHHVIVPNFLVGVLMGLNKAKAAMKAPEVVSPSNHRQASSMTKELEDAYIESLILKDIEVHRSLANTLGAKAYTLIPEPEK